MNSIIQVSTTSDDREELETIATGLVEVGLAACCQISGPVTSLYKWKNKTESSTEWVCNIKTTLERYSSVEAEILRLHHYEQPEIIAVEIVAINTGYQNWICDSVEKKR